MFQNIDKGSLIITKKVTLSDWIQYLIHIRILIYTSIGISLTLMVTYWGFSMIYPEKLTEQTKIALQISQGIIGIILVWMVFFKNSPLNRTNKLFRAIMKREITNLNVIEKEWFRMDNNLNRIKGFIYNPNGVIIFAVMIFITGITLSAIYCENINLCNLGKNLINISIGILAIGIAWLSVNLGKKSDEKMKSIATGDFFEITYRFWDRAPILYRKQNKGVRDTQSWQLGNLFRHGDKLKKWADPDVQEKLIKEFKTFLERLRPIKCEKYWVEIKNYMGICNIAIGFKTENDDIKDELIDELGNWIGKKEEGESNKEYLKRKGNEFSQKKKYDIFTG